jgi:hypothetical protein
MFHAVTHGFEHTANLPIDSLSQNNAQTDRRYRMKLRNSCSLTVEKDAAQQFRRDCGVPRVIQCHFVFFLNFVTGMRQTLGEISVICKKKQTFGLCVQPTNVEQTREFCRQQIKNCIAHARIFPGRNESSWLVQHYGERRGNVNKFAIHLDVVARVGLGAKGSAGFTVNSNSAGSD